MVPIIRRTLAGLNDANGAADFLVLDEDGDTSLSSPTDDQIDIEVGGADDFTITANTLTALTGSTIAVADADKLTVNSCIVPQYIYVNYVPQTTEAATDRVIFIAPRACKLVACSQIHSVAAGGASKLMLTKDTGTDAPGAGTDLLTNNTNTGFDLNATANTLQTGTLVAVGATVTFAAGDRLSIDFANTIQSTAGLAISATFQLV